MNAGNALGPLSDHPVAPMHPSTSTPTSTTSETGAGDETSLEERKRAAVRALGPGYRPRTRHQSSDGSPKYVNRLILEASPYLLQHAHNPVDWFPWGDEAFARARSLGRPVFLSVGYSTCHWCHVMEEESFEDEAIARCLNERYVAIKVDREERPDVDSVYMTFVQALTGNGGWPMSVWLSPARNPFFGGTYYPPRAGMRGSGMGFLELLTLQAERFAADPDGVAAIADSMARHLRAATLPAPAGALPGQELLQVALHEAARRYDPILGGSLGAPKFPSSFPIRLLLRIARRTGNAEASRMAVASLHHMRAGGIYDQVGGGFHRYATDAHWLVPHFEKMLYDNALLAIAYLEAAQATADASLFGTVSETLDYLLRDMQAPEGAFYSATDADSLADDGSHTEGYYFTWTPADLRAILGAGDAMVAQAWYGVGESGQEGGRSILSALRSPRAVAEGLGLAPAALPPTLARIRARLLAARSRRPPPLRDDKIIVAWNGLAVSAFARSAIVLGEPRYADAAVRAASFLLTPFRTEHRLPHLFVHGLARGRGFADDHVMLAAGLLDVFELTADPTWLAHAIDLMEEVEAAFSDHERGGYFLSSAHHESLLLRERPAYDGPIPSANSLAAQTWLRLALLTDDDRYRHRAETIIRAFAPALAAHPLALDHMLIALDQASEGGKQIVIVVPDGQGALAPAARPLLEVLRYTFAPHTALVVARERQLGAELARIPWVAGKSLHQGQATAYLCAQGSCQLPTREPATLAAQLALSPPHP